SCPWSRALTTSSKVEFFLLPSPSFPTKGVGNNPLALLGGFTAVSGTLGSLTASPALGPRFSVADLSTLPEGFGALSTGPRAVSGSTDEFSGAFALVAERSTRSLDRACASRPAKTGMVIDPTLRESLSITL
ncbi:unnamed protein product, partial [Mycena citricolor]